MEKRHRVFIAINLPDDIKKILARYYDKWPELPAKWTSKENLHITLEFLGHLTDQEIAQVCNVVNKVALKHESFTINLKKIIFGPVGKFPPKMIWAVGEKSEELSSLRGDLQDSLLESVRFSPESRGFAPHITLARISEWQLRQMNQEEIPEIDENIELIFTAESIEIMESQLNRSGPAYTILESCPLKF